MKTIEPNAKKVTNRTRRGLGLITRHTNKGNENRYFKRLEEATSKRTVIIGMVTGLELHEIVR